jgi:predicted transcriptional regulator
MTDNEGLRWIEANQSGRVRIANGLCMDMRKLVGRNVRKLRIAAGLTQEQYAERSGFSQQYISDLERGRRNPTVLSLFELAQPLDASPAALIREE